MVPGSVNEGVSGPATRRCRRASSSWPAYEVVVLDVVLQLVDVDVSEAKQVLESGDATIGEVAEEVGYADPSFFRRLFGRRVGLTPSQYHRRFRSMRLCLQ